MPKRFPSFRVWLLLFGAVAAGWVSFGPRGRTTSEGEWSKPAPLAGEKARATGLDDTMPRVRSDVLSRVPRDLFVAVATDRAAALTRALPAPATHVRYVHVNRALVVGKESPFWQPAGSGSFDVELPGGGHARVVIEWSEQNGPDRFRSAGHLAGRPGSRVLAVWDGGFLHLVIEDSVLGQFVLRPATSELSQWYRVDPRLVLPCGGGRQPDRAAASAARAAASEMTEAGASFPAIATALGNSQRAEVHVLMLHTPAVLPTLSGAARTAAIRGAFELEIARSNAVLESSLVSARLRLVGVAETRYDESASSGSGVQDDALTAVYLTDDGKMDEIHALRDSVGADVVMLALGRGDFASSGLSFLLSTPDEPSNDLFAFSVVHYDSIAGTRVVSHELGHLFGCAHDRQNALSGAGAYSFSYGYRFAGADGRQYRDIMAYPPGNELNYFSNPEVIAPSPVNAPLGIAAGRPGESNTALTIERTAFYAAAFRLQRVAEPNRGTLINVATRAHVGANDEVLIGGFVVQGAGPKAVLVRAAGPALSGFGVEGALADPVLRVFAGGSVAAENDDWGQSVGLGAPVSGAEIATAAASVGAFPFSSGSADAAVLVSLPPGAYTAVVEGARGATGTGLVEAYEVGRDANAARIINLATRGYANRDGREMVAGFVVEAAPDATKRILIRVLGPTLAREPFNLAGVLWDPEFELRNARGEVMLIADDWSSDAEGGVGEAIDFRPVVESYGETQIFATGLAPANRREPCVLVDLPPGAYTVMVRPFERLAGDRVQVARPGVGVVEVYEISR